ncbi:MAG: hypothetical protein LM564_05290 [Desulfurococcaceae archaeon]|nr:hypothetical protein [Desulfurococcaceae archaeon]
MRYTFEVVYMPYSQPLPVPPELAGMLAIPAPTPTAPQIPPARRRGATAEGAGEEG